MSITERTAKVLSEIDAALAMAEKATPGPWTWGMRYVSCPSDSREIAMIPHGSPCDPGHEWPDNAAFMATSRAILPASLRCLKTAIEAILDGVREYGASSSWELQLRRLCYQWEVQA